MNARSGSITTALLILLISLSAMAQKPQPFSAHIKIRQNGKVIGKGDLWFSGTKTRMELDGPLRGRAVIADLDHRKVYLLQPKGIPDRDPNDHDESTDAQIRRLGDFADSEYPGVYWEIDSPMDFMFRKRPTGMVVPPSWTPYDASNPCSSENQAATCAKVGTERVNGRLADKWKATSPRNLGGNSRRTIWIDRESHITIKLDEQNAGWELDKIKVGPQRRGKFEIPRYYHHHLWCCY